MPPALIMRGGWRQADHLIWVDIALRLPVRANLAPYPFRGMRELRYADDDRCGGHTRGRTAEQKGYDMAIGPVQLLVIGFNEPKFEGEVLEEFDRLRQSDTVNVIDAMIVYKDALGDLEVARLSNLSDEEEAEFGATIGALIGLGFAGEEGAEEGAALGAAAPAEVVDALEEGADWDVLAEIPPNTAAAVILLEHMWAVPLRDAIARAGGFRVTDGFISPLDLVEVGLLAREEVETHALENPQN